MTHTSQPGVSARACGILLAVLAVLPMGASAVEVSGYSTAGTFQPYPVAGVPLLESFYFRYTSSDNHVETVAVEPASPIPDPSPESSAVPSGQIFLTLQDKGRDDQIFYKLGHADVPAAGVQRRKTFDFCRKVCSWRLERPSPDHVFVIVGFSFFFPADDHHLRRIGLWEQDGVLHAHFADEDDSDSDDVYKFELEYAYLPPGMVARLGHSSGNDVSGGGERQAIDACGPASRIVIRGFDFEFRPVSCHLWSTCQDQHIREIGVLTPGNYVEVYFADKNPYSEGDKFNWGVDWAVLAL